MPNRVLAWWAKDLLIPGAILMIGPHILFTVLGVVFMLAGVLAMVLDAMPPDQPDYPPVPDDPEFKTKPNEED